MCPRAQQIREHLYQMIEEAGRVDDSICKKDRSALVSWTEYFECVESQRLEALKHKPFKTVRLLRPTPVN